MPKAKYYVGSEEEEGKNRAVGAEGVPVLDMSPEEEAALLDTATDPFISLARAAKVAGLDPKVTNAMIARLKAQKQPFTAELHKAKTKELIDLLNDRAHRALTWMDDYKLAAASPKDLAIIAGIMLEKRQLLRGEPTQILSIEERASMNKLIPELMKEAKRRNMIIDAEYEDVTVQADLMRPKAIGTGWDDFALEHANKEKEASGEPVEGLE